MTAAASAAKGSQALVGEPGNGREAALALTLVIGGGLVEGVALGGLQAVGLGRLLPGLDRRRWMLVTAVAAGLGWALASAPSAMSGPGDGSVPPLPLILVGAVGLGAVMGALLGAAQATVLRGHVRHPWRWVGASATAWAPTMAVIFLGATAPDAAWSAPVVAVLGTGTGLVAGALLGLVSGWFLPTLDGPPAYNLLVLRLLGSPALASATRGAVGRSLVAMRVRGVVTGHVFEFPVQCAVGDDAMVILPGRPQTKRWWRNLAEPAPVDVLVLGRWQPGEGVVLLPDDPGYDSAIDSYRKRFSRARIPQGSPLVRVRVVAAADRPADLPSLPGHLPGSTGHPGSAASRLIPAEARTRSTPPAAGSASGQGRRPGSQVRHRTPH
jgi:hypothetical protein